MAGKAEEALALSDDQERVWGQVRVAMDERLLLGFD